MKHARSGIRAPRGATRAAVRVLISCLLFAPPALLAAPQGGTSSSVAAVKLGGIATPPTAEPRVTVVALIGSGFPPGAIAPTSVTVTLTPQSGSGPSATASAIGVTTLFGSTRRVTFVVPPDLAVATAVPYVANVSGSASVGGAFASTTGSVVIVQPRPSLNSPGVVVVPQGHNASVSITGNYTSFFQGSTMASFGPGVSVGGAPAGAFGPITVISPTSATARISVASNAALGTRTLSVHTGVQTESVANALLVGTSVLVPSVVDQTQAAAMRSITSAGLVVGMVTTSSSSGYPGIVLQQTPAWGTSVNAGSPVNLVVSSGAGLIAVPNVVGETQAAATAAITKAGLVVAGTAQQHSFDFAAGTVIGTQPGAGSFAGAGSGVYVLVSDGKPATNPVAMRIDVPQNVLAAGASGGYFATAVDATGVPVGDNPTCTIAADPTATGVPAVLLSDGEISTDISTRGVYTLTCTLVTPSLPMLTASTPIIVLPPADPSVKDQEAILADFSHSINRAATALDVIKADVKASNANGVTSALDTLKFAASSVSLDDLASTAAFAPEGGFPASASNLPSFGIAPTAADANLRPFLNNLIRSVDNLTRFLQTTPLATLTPAQKAQYLQMESSLATLAGNLPSLDPSTYGVAANADQEDFLLSTVLPRYYEALAQSTLQYLTAEGFTASLRRPTHNDGPVLAESNRGDVRLIRAGLHGVRGARIGVAYQIDFGSVGQLVSVADLQMTLIKQIYIQSMQYIAKAAATITFAQAFQPWAGGQNLYGVITGAELQVNTFNAAATVIEGNGLNATPGNNYVYLIGPDQVNGSTTLYQNVATYVKDLGKNSPKDISAANKQLQGFRAFFQGQNSLVQCLYDESLQIPGSTQAAGKCVSKGSSTCLGLVYSNGLNSVYNPAGLNVPLPVTILVWNVPTGAWSVGTYNFVAAASPTPPGECKP